MFWSSVATLTLICFWVVLLAVRMIFREAFVQLVRRSALVVFIVAALAVLVWIAGGTSYFRHVQQASSSLVVSPAKPPGFRVSTGPLHLALLGKPYQASLTAADGVPAYSWKVDPGQLPRGLSLNARTGQINGTPDQGGQFELAVTVTDSTGATASKNFTLQVFELALDKYGGLAGIPCAKGAQPHFYTQKSGSRWHLCTPAGHVFWLNGMFNASLPDFVDYQGVHSANLVASKYATGATSNSTLNWALQSARRLQSWGFTGLSQYGSVYLYPTSVDNRWGTSDSTIPVKMPFVILIKPSSYALTNLNNYASGPVKDMIFGIKTSVYTGWRAHMADHFDARFQQWFDGDLSKNNFDRSWFLGPNNDYVLGFDIEETDVLQGFRAGPDFPIVRNNAVDNSPGDPHLGWMVLITAARQAANPNFNAVYADPVVYSKQELSNWLSQRYGGSIASLNAAWGSNYSTFGSSGTLYSSEGVGVGNGTTASFTKTLAHAPVAPNSVLIKVGGTPLGGDGGDGYFYPGSSVAHSAITSYKWGFISVSFNTAPASGASVTVTYSACHPVATYTTTIGTGDGTTKTFNYNINDHAVGPGAGDSPCYSVDMVAGTVQVQVGGAVQGNDTAGGGILTGPGIANTFVNYANGALTVSFVQPPSSGATVTVDYQTGGFGIGTGLLDEDGTCPAKTAICWVSTDPYLLAGETAQMTKDLDDFMLHYAQFYFSTIKSTLNARAPGMLYFGPNPIGSWGAPPRRQILQAASQYVDVYTVQLPPMCANCTDIQQRIDFTAQYGGDKPWFGWEGYAANADSYMSPYASPSDFFQTQQARGQMYQSRTTVLLNAADTATGTNHIVGFHWWDLYDMPNEQLNWGLLTPRDDAYDGASATTTPGADSWGYPTGCLSAFGCEKRDYGNFIQSVTKANLEVLRRLAAKP